MLRIKPKEKNDNSYLQETSSMKGESDNEKLSQHFVHSQLLSYSKGISNSPIFFWGEYK